MHKPIIRVNQLLDLLCCAGSKCLSAAEMLLDMMRLYGFRSWRLNEEKHISRLHQKWGSAWKTVPTRLRLVAIKHNCQYFYYLHFSHILFSPKMKNFVLVQMILHTARLGFDTQATQPKGLANPRHNPMVSIRKLLNLKDLPIHRER